MMNKGKYRSIALFIMVAIVMLVSISSYAETVNHIYDDLNRLIRAEYADETVIEYEYDEVGNRQVKKTLYKPHTLTVQTAGTGSATVTSSPAGINCGTDCTELYSEGTVVTLTATLDTNTIFTGWSGGGCSETGACTVTMNADTTVMATFVQTYTLTASAGANGSISSEGTITVNYGESKVFAIIPNAGYYIADVRVDGRSVGAVETYPFNNITANHMIEAIFSNAATHTITATSGVGGSISPSGSVTVNYGADQEFAVTPDEGYHIVDVRVDGESVGAVTKYKFEKVSIDHTIEASFSNTYTLTIITTGTGTGAVTSNPAGIVCGADCSETYAQNTVVTLTVTPDSNVGFLGWFGACTGTANTCTVAMNADKTVTAVFSNDSVTYWAKTYGTSNNDQAYSSQQTADGGYIIAGSTGSDAWVLKLEAYGNVEWQKTYGGSGADYAFAIQQTSDGGYIVGGVTNSYGRSDDAWVLKLAASGDIQWQNAYGESTPGTSGVYSREWITSILQTRDGEYVAAGARYSNGQYTPLILKLRADGSIKWQKKLPNANSSGNNYESFYSIQVTADEGYILAGKDTSNVAHVLKLDVDGNIQWQKAYGGTTGSYYVPQSVQQTSDGGYIVAGHKYNLPTTGQMTPIYDRCDRGYECAEAHDGNWAFTGAECIDTYPLQLFFTPPAGFDITGKRPTSMTVKVKAQYVSCPHDDCDLIVNQQRVGTPQQFGGSGATRTVTIPVSTWYWPTGGSDSSGVFNVVVSAMGHAYYKIAEIDVQSVAWETIETTDAWIMKLDANENIQWQKTYKAGQDNHANSIQQTSLDGGYIVGGVYYENSPYKALLWISKLDASGNIQWQKSHDGYDATHATYDHGRTPVARQTPDGYMMAGFTSYLGIGGDDVLVVKLDSQGSISGGCSILKTPSTVTNNAGAYVKSADIAVTDGTFSAISTNVATANTNVTPNTLCSVVLSPPAAPTDLDVWPAYAAQINLRWTDNANDELGYTIERKFDYGTYVVVATVGANVTVYSDTGLIPGVTYYYRVSAFNKIGASTYSNAASAVPVSNPRSVISSSITSWNFGTVVVGGVPGTQTVTIFNTGTDNLAIGTLFVTGVNAGSFTIPSSTDNCSGRTLVPHSTNPVTCTFTVFFAPLSGGLNAAYIVIPSNDPEIPQLNLPLQGMGQFTLTIQRTGTGNGSVTSSPAGINCGTSCTAIFDGGTNITLTATPDSNSSLLSWSGGGCSGMTNPCIFALSSHTTVTAAFSCNDQPVRINRGNGATLIPYQTLQAAYNAAQDQDVIEALAVNFIENLNLNLPITVSIKGGFACGYAQQIGNSTIQGEVTTSDGTITMGNFEIISSASGSVYYIMAAADMGGGISPHGTVMVNRGANQIFTITPDPGYTITNVLVDGASVGAVNVYTFTDIKTNHTIEAIFTNKLVVTKTGTATGTVTSTPEGINCGTDCDEKYIAGTRVTLSATPDPGATFAGWSGGGCTGAGDCDVQMNTDVALTATFDIAPPEADFSATPTNPGVIPFIPVVFTDKSLRAQSWLWDFGDGTTSTEQNPTHTYTTVGAYTVTLTVANTTASDAETKVGYIKVQACPNLPVKVSGSTTTSYYSTLQAAYDAASDGDTIQAMAIDYKGNLNANRDISVKLSGGYDCGCGTRIGTSSLQGQITTSAGTLTIENVVLTTGASDDSYSISARADVGGSISPSGTIVAALGTSETFTITPYPGYTIVDVFVDGISQGPRASYPFENISSDHTIEAIFTYLLTVTKTGTATGTVISTLPGINCGTDCSEKYPAGQGVTLRVLPDEGAIFSGWTGGVCTGIGDCLIQMNTDVAVTAKFDIAPPEADFIASPTNPGVIPFVPVVFTDKSLRAQTWFWDFGDGTTSTDQNPTHTYTTVGSYTVSLTVTNTTALNTKTVANYIVVQSCQNLPVKVSGSTTSYFSTIQAAYDAAVDGDTIQTLAIDYMENLNANRNISVALSGGYNCGYTTRIGTTTLEGTIVTSAGTLTAGDLALVTGATDNTYAIAATAGAGGSITPAGTVIVARGVNQTFTMAPEPGYTVVDVRVDGVSVGPVTSYTFSGVTANHRIEAFFLAKLTVTKTGTGSGTVLSVTPGINCGTICTAEYVAGMTVTLTIVPGANSVFAGWSGGGCVGTGNCTLTMNADTAVTAIFNIAPPITDFSGSPTSGIESITVTFTDLSTGNPSSWFWDFGDGTTSTQRNPTHTYSSIGAYSVSLTATNIGGSTTQTKTNYINVQPCPNLPFRISGTTPVSYPTLQAAYDAAADGAVIQSRNLVFTENLNIDRNINITLEGGYTCDYTTISGTTSLMGMITTSAGTTTIKNYILQE